MPIDLKAISKKTYNSFGDLREDFDWFYYHCLSKHRNDRLVVKAANKLKETLKKEEWKLNLCRQCYENKYNDPNVSMEMLCDSPHLLLWVDCGRYGFWPAKLIQCETDDKLAVQYFGDKTYDTVNSSACLMYSKDTPENGYGSCAGTDPFVDAIEVKWFYILN